MENEGLKFEERFFEKSVSVVSEIGIRYLEEEEKFEKVNFFEIFGLGFFRIVLLSFKFFEVGISFNFSFWFIELYGWLGGLGWVLGFGFC